MSAKILTPADLVSATMESGYRHVSVSHSGSRVRPYSSRHNIGSWANPNKPSWRSPRRATALEAAQDYCDWFNGSGVAAKLQPALKQVNHPKRKKRERTEEVKAALAILRDERAKRKDDPGSVYCIAAKGDPYAVKVGFSTDANARPGELQIGNPRELRLLATIEDCTKADEERLHAKHIDANILGEWFRPTRELLKEFGLQKVSA